MNEVVRFFIVEIFQKSEYKTWK